MTATLGGFRVINVQWTGRTAISITIATDYTDRYLQLYAGRRLIGRTNSIGDLTVTGQLQPAHCPHCLTVVMCQEGEQTTDYGDKLPRRPFNQFELAWTADDFPEDAKWFELAAATAAGAAVDSSNVVARIPFHGDGSYSFLFDPITEPGDWSYQITPRDDAATVGNGNHPSTITQSALPYPPDILTQDDDTRLAISVEDGTLTVDFDYDW